MKTKYRALLIGLAGDSTPTEYGEKLAKFQIRHFLKSTILNCGIHHRDNTMTLKVARAENILFFEFILEMI
jgi:hypothetical protein